MAGPQATRLSRSSELSQFFGAGDGWGTPLSPDNIYAWCTWVPGAGTHQHFGKAFSSDVTGDGPPQRTPVAFSVSYPRASIFSGLPSASVKDAVDSIMSDRLSESSHSSIQASLGHWSVVAERHSWPRLIATDDPLRGSKLATFVSYLVYETSIKATSISNYVWGIRQWLKLQHLPDPIFGVLEWDDFMQAVDVVAWVAQEPRKPVPVAVIRAALEAVDLSSFVEVQSALLIVILFFTFARSESPCPKSYTGKGSFDPTKHLQVKDVEVRFDEATGSAYVAVRLKAIKQDPRIERPEAAGNEDWIFIGDVDGPFSVLTWLSRFWAFFPADSSSPPRPLDSPFFRDSERERVLTYSRAKDDVRALYSKVAPLADVSTYGLHGLRVEAYNRARSHDPLLAVAQGGWASSAHKRYARFNVADVLALPAAMIAGVAHAASSALAPTVFNFLEPPSEIAIPRSSGPRLGRARRPGTLVVASAPSPPPRARTRTRPGVHASLPPPSPPTPLFALARISGRERSADQRRGSTPPASPPPTAPPRVRRSVRGEARAVAFSGSYLY